MAASSPTPAKTTTARPHRTDPPGRVDLQHPAREPPTAPQVVGGSFFACRQPATGVAVAARIALTSNGVAPGWRARMRAAYPARCGAANELPVARIRPPPRHATSTSTPYAPNSTGGAGL